MKSTVGLSIECRIVPFGGGGSLSRIGKKG